MPCAKISQHISMFVIIYMDWINTLSDIINKSLEKCIYWVWHAYPSAHNQPKTSTDIFIQFDIDEFHSKLLTHSDFG